MDLDGSKWAKRLDCARGRAYTFTRHTHAKRKGQFDVAM
jgi:hypothetical protein